MGDHSNDTNTSLPHRVTATIERALNPASIIMLIIAFLGGIGAAKGTVQDTSKWTCVHALHRCTPPPHHYAIYDYITTNPAKHPKRYDYDTVAPLGITDGTTPETIAEMLPPTGRTHQVTAAADANWHTETWTWRGLQLGIEVQDTSKATRNATVTRLTGPYYIAVGNGLVLGTSTLRDAIDLSFEGPSQVTADQVPQASGRDMATSPPITATAYIPLFAHQSYVVTTNATDTPPIDLPLRQRLTRESTLCRTPIATVGLRPAQHLTRKEPTLHSCFKPPLVLTEAGRGDVELWFPGP